MIEPSGTKVTLPPNRQGKVPGLGNAQSSGQSQPNTVVNDNAGSDRAGIGDLPSAGATVTIGVQGQDPFHTATDSNDVYPSAQDMPLIEVGTSTVSLSGVSEGDHPVTLPGSASKGYGVMTDPDQNHMTPPFA